MDSRERLRAAYKELGDAIAAAFGESAVGGGSTSSNGYPEPGSEADLASKYGDPLMKGKPPRDWNGDSMEGKRYSECPSDYLRMFADMMDAFAIKKDRSAEPKEREKASWNRRDAARARAWAKRNEGKFAATTPREGAIPFGGDDGGGDGGSGEGDDFRF